MPAVDAPRSYLHPVSHSHHCRVRLAWRKDSGWLCYGKSSVIFENNVYAQIGLVMLIGLAAKNAILIVEFSKAEYEKGTPIVEAALAGARLRLRPILMTAFAFILGCVPLWAASGSGAASRQIRFSARRLSAGCSHRL